VDQRENTAASGKHNLTDEDFTRAVLASFGNSKAERFRQVVQSLVRHLHAFISEVKLTEEEWFKGIDFLTRTGHITDDERQEFILLSDVLGVSMLVVGINHRHLPSATESGEAVEVVGGATDHHPTGTTEATDFGPFFVEGSPRYKYGDDIANGASGERCFMQGRVLSTTGEPVPDARIEV
jgi:hydroxyquinol 1,2-dioxygenase